MTLFRTAGQSAAETTISGEISIFATWQEDIYFFDPDGSAMDLSAIAFHFQFRSDPAATDADVTLSTAAGTLSIEEDEGSVESILRITAPAGTFDQYEGDMIADLIGVDGSSNVTHYAHGVVAFRNDPVAL